MNGQEMRDDRRRDMLAATMQARAGVLRRQSHLVHPLVGLAYRRRAAELELSAAVLARRSTDESPDNPEPLAA